MHKETDVATIPIKVLLHEGLTPAEKIIFIFLKHKEEKLCTKSNKEIANLAGGLLQKYLKQLKNSKN